MIFSMDCRSEGMSRAEKANSEYENMVVNGRHAVNELTQILSRIEAEDPEAAEKLLPLVYTEL